jgi:transaldolase
MEIWLDSTDFETILEAVEMGILHGVTTNPSIIARSGLKPEDALKKLLDVQPGPVTMQVLGKTAEKMVEEAKKFHAFSKRIMVKIPSTKEGFKAMKVLSSLKIPVMATAVYTPLQALMAGTAGAEYIAFYLSRIADSGVDSIHVLNRIQDLKKHYHYPVKFLAASIRFYQQIEKCLENGIHAITIDEKLFRELAKDHPLTLERLESFERDWQKVK